MGSMFGGGLTKTAVSDAGGKKYYDNPIQAGQAQQQGASLYMPDLSGQQMGESNPIPVTKGPDPTISKPDFNQVRDNPEAQTTKGKALGFVLALAQGAGIGSGQDTFGGGFGAETKHLQNEEDRKIRNRALATEDALKQIEIQQRPQLFQLGVKSKQGEIAKDAAMANYYTAGVGKREKTKADVDAEMQAAADASGYAKGSREYNQIRFGDTLDPKAEKNPTPYGDIRSGFPDTPEGHARSARSFLATVHPDKTPLNAEQNTTVEQTVAHYLSLSKGDPDEAQTMFNQKVEGVLTDHPELATLVPEIQKRFKGSGRGKRTSKKPSLTFAQPVN